jgi:hypothetical protein
MHAGLREKAYIVPIVSNRFSDQVLVFVLIYDQADNWTPFGRLKELDENKRIDGAAPGLFAVHALALHRVTIFLVLLIVTVTVRYVILCQWLLQV